jgi:hypothetical protein
METSSRNKHFPEGGANRPINKSAAEIREKIWGIVYANQPAVPRAGEYTKLGWPKYPVISKIPAPIG